MSTALLRRFGLTALAAAIATSTLIPVAEAAGDVRSAVSLSAPAAGAYGTSISLTGVLWRYGTSTRIPNATVTLQRAPHGRATWARLSTARTNAGGGFRFAVKQLGAFDYRVTYGGSATYTSATSPVRYPVTAQKVLFDKIATTDAHRGRLTATGRIYPVPPNGTASYLQRWDGRRWVGVGTGRTSGGQVSIVGTRPGSVATYRIVVPARSPYGAGSSVNRRFAHHVWRGVFVRPILEVRKQGDRSYFVDDISDPTDRIAVTSAFNQGDWVWARLNSAGCIAVASRSVERQHPGPTVVTIQGSGMVTVWKTITAPNSPVDLNTTLPADMKDFWFSTTSQGAGGFNLELRIAVRCSN